MPKHSQTTHAAAPSNTPCYCSGRCWSHTLHSRNAPAASCSATSTAGVPGSYVSGIFWPIDHDMNWCGPQPCFHDTFGSRLTIVAKPQDSAPAQAPAERMNSNVNNAPPPAPVQRPPENVRPAPGVDIGGGRRGCLPGDSSPAGTVADGYKKVSTNYAFGPICYWESTR